VAADLLQELEANTTRREKLLAERDRLILAAKEAHVPVVRIAEAAGLTRQQVHRIIAAGV
jgi:hypothetical protein